MQARIFNPNYAIFVEKLDAYNGFLFAFHDNYGHIFNRLWDINVKE